MRELEPGTECRAEQSDNVLVKQQQVQQYMPGLRSMLLVYTGSKHLLGN